MLMRSLCRFPSLEAAASGKADNYRFSYYSFIHSMTSYQLVLLLVLLVATCLAGGKYFVRDVPTIPLTFVQSLCLRDASILRNGSPPRTKTQATVDPQNEPAENSGGRAAPTIVVDVMAEQELHEERFTQSATETLREKPGSLFALACDHTYRMEEFKEIHPELYTLFALGEKLSVHMGPEKGLEAFLAPTEEIVHDGHRGTASSSPPILIFCHSARYYISTQEARATRTASGMEKRAETDGGATADTVCPYPAPEGTVNRKKEHGHVNQVQKRHFRGAACGHENLSENLKH